MGHVETDEPLDDELEGGGDLTPVGMHQAYQPAPPEMPRVRAFKEHKACGFCGKPFTDARPLKGYVYPVAPREGLEPDRVDGRNACVECHGREVKRSVEAGLLILVNKAAPAGSAKKVARRSK